MLEDVDVVVIAVAVVIAVVVVLGAAIAVVLVAVVVEVVPVFLPLSFLGFVVVVFLVDKQVPGHCRNGRCRSQALCALAPTTGTKAGLT